MSYPERSSEVISGSQSFDLDSDGMADLIIYDFESVTQNNITLRRQVAVVAHTKSNYTSFNALSSSGLVLTRSKLDQFDSRQRLKLQGCANSVGLKQDCTLTSACTVLCQGSSKCKRTMDKYGSIVPASMIEFVDDRNELDTSLLNSRNNVLNLNVVGDEEKDEYLNELRRSIAKIAQLYSNPIYTRDEIDLCSSEDLGIDELVDAADDIGSYTTSIDHYSYFVTVLVVTDSDQVSGVELRDSIPAGFVESDSDFASEQNVDFVQNGSDYSITWTSERSAETGYMLSYRFDSVEGPEAVTADLKSPAVGVNKLDIAFLGATEFFFVMMYEMSGNFFVALGSAFAISLIILIIIFNIISIGISAIKAKTRGDNPLIGIRSAFARTELSWRSDIGFGVVLLAGGMYLSYFVVEVAAAPITLLGAIEYFTILGVNVNAAIGLAAVGLIFLGSLSVFRALENLTKITILEQAYGVEVKRDQESFDSKVRKLKNKIKDLSRIVEEYSADEFDVGQEYDVLTSISVQRIDELSKKMTNRSKKVLDDDLNRVEAAIERLTERKKMADDNWPKWSDAINRMLGEQNEVYVSSMITIPASLRTWALRRYANEFGNDSIIFERDSLKKKEVSPQYMLKGLIDRKLIKGAVVIKKDKVIAAQMQEGAATVSSVLAIKLRNYLKSLSRSLGQHEPVSFATVGSKNVFVLMKIADLESAMFIPKDKFKEAVAEFKKKAKAIN
jgi:hypothetical protein